MGSESWIPWGRNVLPVLTKRDGSACIQDPSVVETWVVQYADLAIKVLMPESLSGEACVINNMVTKSTFLWFNIGVETKVTAVLWYSSDR